MGGSVTVESRQGEGSTFTATLPLRRDAALPGIPTERDSADQAGDLPTLRVLAAEDNAINQLVLRTMLQQAGVDPTIVADGRQAIEAWEQAEWDVILMDIQMPEMDGLSATRAIREREGQTGRRRTPIIALTANAMAHHVSEYAANDMDSFVAKPIEVGRLFAAMDAALSEAGEDKQAMAV